MLDRTYISAIDCRNPLSSQVISNLTWTCLKWAALRVVIPYQVRSYQTDVPDWKLHAGGYVVIPYQVRSYQTNHWHCRFMGNCKSRNPLSSQVISNIELTWKASLGTSRNPLSSQVISNGIGVPIIWNVVWRVVIPYQVRSYQTKGPARTIQSRGEGSRNPLSSQVISNMGRPT